MSSFVVLRSPFEEDRPLWESWVRWGLNERAPERDVTDPDRDLLRGLGSCDRLRLLAPMLSLGEGASPTQLPVRTGGGRRFGDRAGCWLFWYRATGSSSKSTAVGPDWARCGSGRTAAAMVPRVAAAPGDQWPVASATSARCCALQRPRSGRWQHSQALTRAQGASAGACCCGKAKLYFAG